MSKELKENDVVVVVEGDYQGMLGLVQESSGGYCEVRISDDPDAEEYSVFMDEGQLEKMGEL